MSKVTLYDTEGESIPYVKGGIHWAIELVILSVLS